MPYMVESHARVEPGEAVADAGVLVGDNLGIGNLPVLVYTLCTK